MATTERSPVQAVDDTITIKLPRTGSGVLSGATPSNANAGTTLVLEYTWNDADWIGPIKLNDPVAGAQVANLSGPSKAGWAESAGASQARLRVSAFVAPNIAPSFVYQPDE